LDLSASNFDDQAFSTNVCAYVHSCRLFGVTLAGRGTLLTNYFSHNGMSAICSFAMTLSKSMQLENHTRCALTMKSPPKMLKNFQYVGSDANTVPFEQVPAVIEARQLIQDRILQALGVTSEFNEVLR
jgi:hypothetical protein